MEKPFSEACVRNQKPILEQIKPFLADRSTVLEIGSGTGQHAVYFASQLAHITWQTSDRLVNHEGINQWLAEAQLSNLRAPIALDVFGDNWPDKKFDVLYTANTFHIMPWEGVLAVFEHAPSLLNPLGFLMVYGPFNYRNDNHYLGKYTSKSNAQFDQMLQNQASHQGLRDFDAIETIAKDSGFNLLKDFEMPANNRLHIWQYL